MDLKSENNRCMASQLCRYVTCERYVTVSAIYVSMQTKYHMAFLFSQAVRMCAYVNIRNFSVVSSPIYVRDVSAT